MNYEPEATIAERFMSDRQWDALVLDGLTM
jgi:hypothetical protein